MALRLFCLAICTALVIAAGFTGPTSPQSLQRQKPVTDSAFDRRLDGAAAPPGADVSARPGHRSQSAGDVVADVATDVVATDHPFAASHIERLLETGQILIEHPEGGRLPVTLRDVRHRHGTRVLRILSDGLPGVITQRGGHFIGTLATRGGTYNLSFHPGSGRPDAVLVDQRQLDMRIIPNLQDFRHAPRQPLKTPAA